jgi:orotate phosphoribosyltransferase-like protein
VQVKIPLNETIPVYQKLASKIKELKALGMSNGEIASKLKINKKTVGKGMTFEPNGL